MNYLISGLIIKMGKNINYYRASSSCEFEIVTDKGSQGEEVLNARNGFLMIDEFGRDLDELLNNLMSRLIGNLTNAITKAGEIDSLSDLDKLQKSDSGLNALDLNYIKTFTPTSTQFVMFWFQVPQSGSLASRSQSSAPIDMEPTFNSQDSLSEIQQDGIRSALNIAQRSITHAYDILSMYIPKIKDMED